MKHFAVAAVSCLRAANAWTSGLTFADGWVWHCLAGRAVEFRFDGCYLVLMCKRKLSVSVTLVMWLNFANRQVPKVPYEARCGASG